MLKSIKITNYRSISELSIDIDVLEDKSLTYGFIGINEAGKSNILKAIALKDSPIQVTSKDFKNKSETISVQYFYEFTNDENKWFINFCSESDEYKSIKHWDGAVVSIIYEPEKPSVQIKNLEVFSLTHNQRVTVDPSTLDTMGLHTCIFWTADEKFLISQPINQLKFASEPDSVSIPLKNCFLLSGYTDVAKTIQNATDSTDVEDLQETLGRNVTEHIKTVWPNHPITISFYISNGLINFHVKDESSKGKNTKAKTADQRSDGFRQFISFLLTISAENKNNVLENTILLLDEPETHLHPKAQEYLLSELKKLSQNNRNNIVLFATHSNYMIDKEDLSRNYKVVKNDESTAITKLNRTTSTFASVSYEVFDIASSDYHNQLYGKLHENFIEEHTEEDKSRQTTFDTEYLNQIQELNKEHPLKNKDNCCTLPTYIRNCIHHPENGNRYTEAQLRKSINLLRNYLNIQ